MLGLVSSVGSSSFLRCLVWLRALPGAASCVALSGLLDCTILVPALPGLAPCVGSSGFLRCLVSCVILMFTSILSFLSKDRYTALNRGCLKITRCQHVTFCASEPNQNKTRPKHKPEQHAGPEHNSQQNTQTHTCAQTLRVAIRLAQASCSHASRACRRARNGRSSSTVPQRASRKRVQHRSL